MDIESFKNEALVNDIGFIYLDKEYSIIMDNNSYIAVDSDDNVTNIDKFSIDGKIINGGGIKI